MFEEILASESLEWGTEKLLLIDESTVEKSLTYIASQIPTDQTIAANNMIAIPNCFRLIFLITDSYRDLTDDHISKLWNPLLTLIKVLNGVCIETQQRQLYFNQIKIRTFHSLFKLVLNLFHSSFSKTSTVDFVNIIRINWALLYFLINRLCCILVYWNDVIMINSKYSYFEIYDILCYLRGYLFLVNLRISKKSQDTSERNEDSMKSFHNYIVTFFKIYEKLLKKESTSIGDPSMTEISISATCSQMAAITRLNEYCQYLLANSSKTVKGALYFKEPLSTASCAMQLIGLSHWCISELKQLRDITRQEPASSLQKSQQASNQSITIQTTCARSLDLNIMCLLLQSGIQSLAEYLGLGLCWQSDADISALTTQIVTNAVQTLSKMSEYSDTTGLEKLLATVVRLAVTSRQSLPALILCAVVRSLPPFLHQVVLMTLISIHFSAPSSSSVSRSHGAFGTAACIRLLLSSRLHRSTVLAYLDLIARSLQGDISSIALISNNMIAYFYSQSTAIGMGVDAINQLQIFLRLETLYTSLPVNQLMLNGNKGVSDALIRIANLSTSLLSTMGLNRKRAHDQSIASPPNAHLLSYAISILLAVSDTAYSAHPPAKSAAYTHLLTAGPIDIDVIKQLYRSHDTCAAKLMQSVLSLYSYVECHLSPQEATGFAVTIPTSVHPPQWESLMLRHHKLVDALQAINLLLAPLRCVYRDRLPDRVIQKLITIMTALSSWVTHHWQHFQQVYLSLGTTAKRSFGYIESYLQLGFALQKALLALLLTVISDRMDASTGDSVINTLKLSGATVLRVHTSTLPAQCSIPPVNCIYTHSFDTFKSQVLRTYISSVLAIIRSLPADLRDYAKQSVPPQLVVLVQTYAQSKVFNATRELSAVVVLNNLERLTIIAGIPLSTSE